MAKRVTEAERSVLFEVVAGLSDGVAPDHAALASATRTACRLLAERHPGKTLELRVPPFAAVQLGIGDRGAHTRGTPPNVVETTAITLLELASGGLDWDAAVAAHRVFASGPHTDLSGVFPLS